MEPISQSLKDCLLTVLENPDSLESVANSFAETHTPLDIDFVSRWVGVTTNGDQKAPVRGLVYRLCAAAFENDGEFADIALQRYLDIFNGVSPNQRMLFDLISMAKADEGPGDKKVFCPTGPGGGVDPTCGGDDSRSSREITPDHKITLDRVIKIARKSTGSVDNTLESFCEPFAEKVVSLLRNRNEHAKVVGYRSDSAPVHHVFVETYRKGTKKKWIDASGVYDSPEDLLASFTKANPDVLEEGGGFQPIDAAYTSIDPDYWQYDSSGGEKGSKVFCPTGPGGGVDPTCKPGQPSDHSLSNNPYSKGWEKDLTEEEKTELDDFFFLGYEWMRPLQKAGKGFTPPKSVHILIDYEVREKIKAGEIKEGEVYQGEDIKEFALNKPESEWPVKLARGQRVLKIEAVMHVEPTPAQIVLERQKWENRIKEHKEMGGEQWDIRLGNFEGAVEKAPNYKGDAWRALYEPNLLTDIYMEGIKVGGTIKMQAHSSATTDPERALRYLNEYRSGVLQDNEAMGKIPGILFSLKTKTAADVRSRNPGEDEILLRDGTEYRVVSIGKTGVDHLVQLEEM